jgi:drug/metabolite transporter (DMT)-like permease
MSKKRIFLKSQPIAYKYALIAVLLWSTVASAFKISLNYLEPIELVFYAVISSTLCLYCIILYQKKLSFVLPYIKKNYYQIALLGLINPFLYYVVLFEAYDRLPAQEAQSINYTWALMLTFLSVLFLNQKLHFRDILAGIICYFGVLIIATKGEPFSLSFSNLDGVFLALFSTILWSMYWIINTKNKVDPIIGLFSNFLFSLPFIIILALMTDSLNSVPSLYGILAATYVGLFEMGITFLFWLIAMQYAESTSKIANLIFISPFISLVLIHFIVGEDIYISTVFGLVTIIIGLVLQQYKSKEDFS